MNQVSYPVVFVTGTDTEVGKTVISCSLLEALKTAGRKVDGFKPVASGANFDNGQWTNEDGLAHQRYSYRDLPYEWVNPNTYEPAIAPHIAARQIGQPIEPTKLHQQLQRLAEGSEMILVEGAGGWQVPLNDQQRFSDWVSGHQWPVVLVVGIRLGCINHALLSVQSITQAGCRVVGWVANHIEPSTDVLAENVDYLKQHLDAPLIGIIDYQQGEVEPEMLAHRLNVSYLL